MNMILAIAAGGAIGAVLRHLFGAGTALILGTNFPWSTLSVNIIGSFLMGALVTYFALSFNPSQELRAFLTIGLLGAFTTFSAFSLDAFQLWERGAITEMIGYILGSVLLSIGGLALGIILIKQVLS